MRRKTRNETQGEKCNVPCVQMERILQAEQRVRGHQHPTARAGKAGCGARALWLQKPAGVFSAQTPDKKGAER